MAFPKKHALPTTGSPFVLCLALLAFFSCKKDHGPNPRLTLDFSVNEGGPQPSQTACFRASPTLGPSETVKIDGKAPVYEDPWNGSCSGWADSLRADSILFEYTGPDGLSLKNWVVALPARVPQGAQTVAGDSVSIFWEGPPLRPGETVFFVFEYDSTSLSGQGHNVQRSVATDAIGATSVLMRRPQIIVSGMPVHDFRCRFHRSGKATEGNFLPAGGEKTSSFWSKRKDLNF